MIKVLFRLDSGTKNGLGHFMRCKALADALIHLKDTNTYKNSFECSFAVKIIHSAGLLMTPHKVIYLSDETEFILLAKSYQIIIIDHYDYSSEFFYQLSQIEGVKLIVVDDECNRGNLYADMIINSASQANLLNYNSVSAKAKLILGSKYVLLNAHFQSVKLQDYSKRNLIIINFGGSDLTHLTLPVLKRMKQSNNKALSLDHFVVITGAGCESKDIIAQFCSSHNINYQHNVDNMAEFFAHAKLAIAAAGSTVFELCSCGVPSIFAVVADNQVLSAQQQQKLGWCRTIDCRVDNRVDELVQEAEQMLNSNQLEKISHLAEQLIDTKGAERVALEIKQLIA